MTGGRAVESTSSLRENTPACDHCRRKKLRCDRRKPSCTNCSSRGRECIANNIPKKQRPTNRRLQELEEENRRFHALFAAQGHVQVEAPGSTQTVFPERQECYTDNSTDRISSPNGTQIRAEAPESIRTSYHGPTSALFDQNPRSPSYSQVFNQTHHVVDETTRCVLVAEASKQRQLEQINFTAKRLDFDGVDPKLGMQLLSLYWARQLHAGLIIYRPAFMRDMACSGPYFSKLLLNSMYYSVSKHCPDTSIRQNKLDIATAGWNFRQRFTDLLSKESFKSEITTIQALLIMASSLFTRCDERSASWLYAGNAFNMMIDLGLHVLPSSGREATSENLEIRTRIFWSAYYIDKLQCLYQGRHPCLRIADSDVPATFSDDYEELQVFEYDPFTSDQSFGAIPSYNISLMRKLSDLSIIMERIQTCIYSVGSAKQSLESLQRNSVALQLELQAWRNSFPPYLDFIASGAQQAHPLPYHLSALALYNVLVILTHRPLVSDNRVHPSSPNIAYKSLAACVSAATEITNILLIYEKFYRPTSATFSLSYATYISATIHVRVISQQENQSAALDSLRTCLNSLEKHQSIYSAARRAKSVIESLMASMGVQLESSERISEQARHATRESELNGNNVDANGDKDLHEVRLDDNVDLVTMTQDPEFWDLDPGLLVQNFRGGEIMGEGWLDMRPGTLFNDL